MTAARVWSMVFSLTLLSNSILFAAETPENEEPVLPPVPMVGSWTFSGMVSNESGDRYGYFFQVQRQGIDFHTKTALIDGQTNKLVLFYEGDEKIMMPTQLNWHVGRSFIRYNPINDSWVFGMKSADNKGFNFKVDMLKQTRKDNEIIELRPGVEMQALQTSSLNGHIAMGDVEEQFVTGNNAWFGKLWVSKDQKKAHDVSTTFCRLSNENGFYSANMKEADATRAAVAGWRDAAGNHVKMSQFISIKPLENDQCQLHVGLPKVNLKLLNSLSLTQLDLPKDTSTTKKQLSIAGFSKENPKGFCFVAEQSLKQLEQLG
ncbi:MAG: hypothetical protein EPN84_03920 [Legionella sp.]|nr:MAG: hypothetical protein EPN84_03920 [Legionella sp.]